MDAREDSEEQPHSREEIMQATYRALCKHGYANLTMEKIAAEFDKSKALLHYHYDSKEDLMLAFLGRFLDHLDETVAEYESEDPTTRLEAFVDKFVPDPEEDQRETFGLALLELRMQSAHNDDFREQLSENYEGILEVLASIIQDGIDEGVFREVDPYQTAEGMYAAIDGARHREVALGHEGATRRVRNSLIDSLIDDLLVESQTPEIQT